MRVTKYLIMTLIIFVITQMPLACSGLGSPDSTNIETAIKNALKEKVPVQLSGYMGGGRDATIKEIKIIEVGEKKIVRDKELWAVKVYLEGDCEVGSKWSGNIDPLRRKALKGEVIFYLYKDEFDKWKAKHKGF